jgi:hypothetical protein
MCRSSRQYHSCASVHKVHHPCAALRAFRMDALYCVSLSICAWTTAALPARVNVRSSANIMVLSNGYKPV